MHKIKTQNGNIFCLRNTKEYIQSIKELGISTPSEIQEKAIPILLNSNTDFIGLAQTGTGKTAAFGLPILHHIDAIQTIFKR